MVSVVLLSAIALFAPYSDTDVWIKAHRTMEWGCFIFAASYLLGIVLQWFARRISLLRHFQDLPGDERRVILSFMKWNQRTTGLISSAPAAVALVRLGVLEVAEVPNTNNLKVKRGDSFFTIKSWAFRYFRKHPRLYSIDNEIISGEGVSV